LTLALLLIVEPCVFIFFPLQIYEKYKIMTTAQAAHLYLFIEILIFRCCADAARVGSLVV
jgi:hypothetical protein